MKYPWNKLGYSTILSCSAGLIFLSIIFPINSCTKSISQSLNDISKRRFHPPLLIRMLPDLHDCCFLSPIHGEQLRKQIFKGPSLHQKSSQNLTLSSLPTSKLMFSFIWAFSYRISFHILTPKLPLSSLGNHPPLSVPYLIQKKYLCCSSLSQQISISICPKGLYLAKENFWYLNLLCVCSGKLFPNLQWEMLKKFCILI